MSLDNIDYYETIEIYGFKIQRLVPQILLFLQQQQQRKLLQLLQPLLLQVRIKPNFGTLININYINSF